MQVLLIEDNKKIADIIFEYFEIKGITLDYAHNGQLGYDLAVKQFYDIIILDVMLPKMNGFEVCQKLRDEGVETPILMLTARDAREDMLEGFTQGADDYLVKPFDLDILEARIKALVRRHKGNIAVKHLTFGKLKLDLEKHILYREGKEITLNPAQFTLLKLLIKRAPNIVNRQELMAALWQGEEPDGASLRNHIYQLRNTVDKPFEYFYIKTIAKVGYQLTEVQV